MSVETKPAVIQSLQLGLNILEVIANEKEPLKFTDIQNLTSMTKSNLYKYLFTLCEFGVLLRNPHTNTYMLGPKLIQLGNQAAKQSPLIEIAIPYIKKISEETNLTALLAIPTTKGPIVSYISSAEYGINIGAQIGSTLPLSSSTGIVFSAFENTEPMTEWLEHEFQKNTKKDMQTILKDQEKTRKIHFVSKIEPLIKHVSSFSVPILNFEEKLLGAITIVGHTEAVPKTNKHPISEIVLTTALRISELFGYNKDSESS